MDSGEAKIILVACAAAALPPTARVQLTQGALLGRMELSFRVFAGLVTLRRLRAYLRAILHLGWWRFGMKIFNGVVSRLTSLPVISGIVQKELQKELADIEKSMHGQGDPDALVTLPEKGISAEQILDTARKLQEQEISVHKHGAGKRWAGIYHAYEGKLTELQNTMWGLYNASNCLYEGVFPSIRKYEAELLSWVLHLLHGDSNKGGAILTSGGTESVLIAALAYREQGKQRGIHKPRVIAATSCHPAIVKACHYFGMELTKVPVDESTGFALSASAVRSYLSSDVICIYASAPTFPHGVIDNVEDLGRLAQSHGVGLHVDNCLGGILLSFMDKEGVTAKHQMWDFQVPGVTSISTDVHKYGNASKGVSVVSFRDGSLRRLTYVPITDGCEGLYVTSSLQGSRGGAIVAQAWATMLHHGVDGYAAAARKHAEIYGQYQEAVKRVPGLRLLCPSHASIVPIYSDKYSIYKVASKMQERGWNLFTGQMPPVLSICLGEHHAGILESFEQDLRSCVSELDKDPSYKVKGEAAIYGAMSTTPAPLLHEVVKSYVDMKLAVRVKKGV